MSEKLFIKPKAGLTVRDPETRVPLPLEGTEVAASTYWLRRLRDGDVVEAKSTSKKKD